MTNEILTLSLEQVRPDPEQPRQHFDIEAMDRLKAAIQAVGQLQPIRVRAELEGYVIVDGQRRWLALSALARANPGEERFQSIRAFIGDALDEDPSSRRVVQVLSNLGEDLTPTEKAAALAEIVGSKTSLGVEELAQRIGVSKGQVQFLRQLHGAPPFVRALGTGPDALPLWNLITLVRLHRKLSKWDGERFRDTEGQHQRVADREVKRLAGRAREAGWGKRRLRDEAERVVSRVTGREKTPASTDQLARIRRALSDVSALGQTERAELAELLLEILEDIGRKPGRRTTRAAARA